MNAAPQPAVPKPDVAEIRRTLSVLFEPQDVVELRGLYKRRKRTDAGYFDAEHRDFLAVAAAKLNVNGVAVYVTMNPLDPQILARCANRVEEFARDTATDANIIRRRWLLIDIDPQRPKDTSATDAQLEAAKEKTRQVYAYLVKLGWPNPVVAESGNGMHLFARIDLPNDDASRDLLKQCLEALSTRFDDGQIKIDRAVFNAARIVKLHGTIANKGDHVPPFAPWRVSRLCTVPETIGTVSREQLEALAADIAPTKRATPSAPTGGWTWGEGDVERFLARGNIEAVGPEPHEGALRWKLKACPFNPDHGYGEAAVFLCRDGRLGFECRHNSCQDKHWKDLRALVDGPVETRARLTGSTPPRLELVRPREEPGQKWDEPIDPWDVKATLPPRMPRDILPSVIDEFAFADRNLNPTALAAAALTTCSGALSASIRASVHDQYSQPFVLWYGLCGNASTLKTPHIGAAAGPLRYRNARSAESYARERAEWEKATSNGKTVTPDSPPKPWRRWYVVEDSTIEGIGETLQHHQHGTALIHDEITALFNKMEAPYQKQSGTPKGDWLKLYDGGSQGTVRANSERCIFVQQFAASLLGGVTQETLLKIANQPGSRDGLLARLSIIMMPMAAIHRELMPTPSHLLDRYRHVINRMIATEASVPFDGPLIIPLSEEAREFFQDARVRWLTDAQIFAEDLPLYAERLGKLPGLALRIALGFTAIDHADEDYTGQIARPIKFPSSISWQTMERACRFVDLQKAHDLAFYEMAAGRETLPELVVAQKLAGNILLRKLHSFITRDITLSLRMWRNVRPKDRATALAILEDMNWLQADPDLDTPRWRVNPRVHEVFAERAAAEKRQQDLVRETIRAAAAERAQDG